MTCPLPEPERFYHIEHYDYGEAFTGSCLDRCYRLAREPLENVRFKSAAEREGAVLRASVWKGPFCFDKTPEEMKEYRDFAYTEEGLSEAVGWIRDWCAKGQPLRLI